MTKISLESDVFGPGRVVIRHGSHVMSLTEDELDDLVKSARKRAPGAGRPPLYPDEVTKPSTVRLPPSTWAELEAEARARGLILSAYLRQIIDDRPGRARTPDAA